MARRGPAAGCDPGDEGGCSRQAQGATRFSGRPLVLGLVFGLACCLPALAGSEPAIAAGASVEERAEAPAPASLEAVEAAMDPEAVAPADAAAQRGDDRWRGPPAATPDWRGAARDAGYFVGYQLVALAVLYAAPASVSGWDDEDKQYYSFEKWRDNVSQPVWDADSWAINYILHPYWGGAYYVRARERGLDRPQSFWYSVMLSALWEYGVEALVEPVSIQDLIVTPVLGSLVGEYLFSPWRARIRAKQGALDWSDKAVLALTDPLGAVNAQLEQWLGVKTTLQLQPAGLRLRDPGRGPQALTLPGAVRRSAAGWHLQLHMQW